MSNSRLLTLLLLGALLTALGRWLLLDQDADEQTRRSASDPGAEQVITGMLLSVLNEDGSRHFDLSTERLVQSAGDGSAVMEQPRMTLHRADAGLWSVRADSGWLLEDGSEVRMDGDVQMVRDDALEIRSASMTFFPYQDRARSDVLTTVTDIGSRLSGVGMRADLVRESYRLLADVRGHYDPVDTH